MLLISFALLMSSAVISAPAQSSAPATDTPISPRIGGRWLPQERVEYRQAMRVAFLDACSQICPVKDKACIERCAARPLAEIAEGQGDQEELLACNAVGGAWVAQIPACADALARLFAVTSTLERTGPKEDAGEEQAPAEDGLAQLGWLMDAASGVGRFCSPEGLCQTPPKAASLDTLGKHANPQEK